MERILLNLEHMKRSLSYPFRLKGFGHIISNFYPSKRVTQNNIDFAFILKTDSKNPVWMLEDKALPIIPPCAIVVRPGITTNLLIDRPWDELFFSYNPSSLEQFTKAGISLEPRCGSFVVSERFEKAKDEFLGLIPRINEEGMADRMDMLAFQIIAESMLPQWHSNRTDIRGRTIFSIASHLRKNFTKKIDLESLLRRHGISQRTFYREWKKSFPVSVHKFVMDMRISLAKELLRSSSHKAHEIADMSGFVNSMDFCRNFRKYCGMTPLDYRNKFK